MYSQTSMNLDQFEWVKSHGNVKDLQSRGCHSSRSWRCQGLQQEIGTGDLILRVPCRETQEQCSHVGPLEHPFCHDSDMSISPTCILPDSSFFFSPVTAIVAKMLDDTSCSQSFTRILRCQIKTKSVEVPKPAATTVSKQSIRSTYVIRID